MRKRIFMPICCGVLMLVLTVIGVLGLLGYQMIERVVVYLLVGLLATLYMSRAAIWLSRKMKRNGLRILVGVIGTLIVSVAVLFMFTFFSFVSSFYTPEFYTTLESESGKKVVVMRSFSQEYAAQRCLSRGGELIAYEDLGYEYQIYPVFSKFFYNSKAAAEGGLEIGCGSAAQLMHQWNGDSLHMYIENPEEFDSGELIHN